VHDFSPCAISYAGAEARDNPRQRRGAMMHLRNRDIAELLAREGETAEGHRRRAFRRAARAALSWPAEAADLRSLTELRGVGPYLERVIRGWLDIGTPVPDAPELRRDFPTLAEARAILARDPSWRRACRSDLQA